MSPKLIKNLLIVWAFLQLGRFIAIPIIQGVLSGQDPAAWMFPAVGDILIASSAPFIIYALWKREGIYVWTATLIWLALSIFDHSSTLVASALTPIPKLFVDMTGDHSGTISIAHAVTPMWQAGVDLIFFILLATEKMRKYIAKI